MAKLQTQHVVRALALRTLAALVAGLAALPVAASAQQQAQPPQRPADPPPAASPAPSLPKAPAVHPSETPAATPARDLVGLHVFSADGTRVGEVRTVDTAPSGDIVALHIRTGGFLGFGGRIVAIPRGKFIRSGQSIRLDLDSEEVTGLPEVKD